MQEAGVRCLCSCMLLCLSEPAETEVCKKEAALIGWRRECFSEGGELLRHSQVLGEAGGQGVENLFFVDIF